MMNNNEFIPNLYQLLFEKLDRMERKIDELGREKGKSIEEPPKNELMTVEDAKNYLKISSSTLYQRTARKEIPFMKKGNRLYFKKEDLRQWIEEGRNNPSSKQEKEELVLSYLRPRKKKLG